MKTTINRSLWSRLGIDVTVNMGGIDVTEPRPEGAVNARYRLTKNACVTQRVAAGLGVDAQAVRSFADGDAR